MARFSTSEAPEHRAAAMSEAPLRHPEKAHKPDNPVLRKPDWIRVKAPTSPEYHETRKLMRALKLNTVCEEAACPNIGECWKQKHATVMILGSVCTRACTFCNVATGRPDQLDPHEPQHVAEAVGRLGLSHIVVTSVDRDDLADGGAGHRSADARLPQEGRRDRSGGQGQARHLQPQSRDRAAALRRGAAGRALFRLAAPPRPARRVRGLPQDGLWQGLPHGLRFAADALLLFRRRGFRQAARGARREAGRGSLKADADPCRASAAP